MANTVIQIKRSTSTAAPTNGSLAAAEPAYSYLSDKLFLGTSDGTGTIVVGGKYFVDLSNTIFDVANAAYNAANAAATSEKMNAAFAVANAAYTTANAAYTSSNAAYTTVNAAYTTANASYTTVNAAYTTANAAYTTSNAAFDMANGGFTVANAAYGHANTRYSASGGTISGDVVVTGNLTVSGQTTYANTQTLLIGDNIFVVNADLPGDVAPSENAGFEVNRGSATDVSLLWNEGQTSWTFTNDGSVYHKIASNTDIANVDSRLTSAYGTANDAYTVANAAFGKANTAGSDASGAFTVANAAFGTTNSAFTVANSAYTTANDAYTVANAAFGKANTADTNAANASYLSTGTVPSGVVSGSYTGITGVGTLVSGKWNADVITVPYGGTGMTSFTQNGILFGNTAGDLKVTAAGTEGQVLQASAAGVPQFGMLDGGVF